MTTLPTVDPPPVRDLSPLENALTRAQRRIMRSPARRKAMQCGRRFGKSYLLGVLLYRAALTYPNTVNLFCALSVEVARRLIWTVLQQLDERFSLGARFDNAASMAFLPNGSRIHLKGVGTKREGEKLVGDKYRLVCIDEGQAYPGWLNYVLEEILQPALEDLQGEVVIAGTTNATAAGPFHDLTTGAVDGWEVHSGLTVFDNEKFPLWAGQPDWASKAKAWWSSMLAERGWNEDTPIVRRQWYAEWVRDVDSLILDIDMGRNMVFDLPEGTYRHVIGCDLGWSDATAFVVVCWRPHDPTVYVRDADVESHLISDDKFVRLKRLVDKYDPELIVIDSAAGGRQWAEDLSAKYGLHLVPAKKQSKIEYMSLLSDECAVGKVKFVEKVREHVEQMRIIEWEDKRAGVISEAYPHDFFDAFRYAWRESPHCQATPAPEAEPEQGTDEWANAYARKLEQQLIEQEREDSWLFGGTEHA